MEECSTQTSNSHINLIVKVNPCRVREGKDHQWSRHIMMSNRVMTFVRRWVADYCATTAAMDDLCLCLSLSKELNMQSIKLNALSPSSTVNGRRSSLFQQAGLMMCRCALSRLQRHHGLAQSGKGGEVINDGPVLFKKLTEATMKQKMFSKKMLGILTIGMVLLTGC